MKFNLIKFLKDYDIRYTNNHEWINIECPFCDDDADHLGIHLEKGGINCFKCGVHSLLELVRELITEENPYAVIKKYASRKDYNDKTEIASTNKKAKQVQQKIIMPVGICGLSKRHKEYLLNRNFAPDTLKTDWEICKGVNEVGDYKFRIIIPVYHEGELVSFQGRDITDRQEPKYKTCHGTFIKDYLYGIDHARNSVIVVEGVTDVWRLGRGNAVATFGIQFSQRQLNILVKRRFKKVGILFDNEAQAQTQADKLKACLNCFDGIDAVKLRLPKGKDPAQLNDGEVQKILKFLV